jgi:signal transduction histidine kinase
MNEALRLERYLESLQTKVSEIKLEEGDLNQVIEDNCQLLQKDFEDRNISILRSLAPDLPHTCFDVVKIHEVFLNIIQNAVEAIGDSGIIRLGTWQNGDTICIQISDNGKGIPNEQIPKIFTPFYTTKEEGSGLGLAFAHRIVKDHGGNISVTSADGKGATFLVTLPLIKQPSEARTEQAIS